MPFQLLTMNKGLMNYTYVLLSEADGRLYIGVTSDLRNRIKLHATGRVQSTAYRRPLKFIYYEAGLSADDAYRRERFLKTGKGGRYLKNRLTSSLSTLRKKKLERH
jgi:putative endonuclease